MTITTIRNDVASFLGLSISTNTRITTTEANQWINEGYRLAQAALAEVNINMFNTTTKEFDTTDGTDTYSLESDFLRMKRLEIQWDDDTDKIRATAIDINQIHGPLNPENESWSQSDPYYAIWDGNIIIKPTPDETSSTWTTDSGSAVKYWYYVLEDDLSDSNTTPILPTSHQHILAYFASHKGFIKLGEMEKANHFLALWEKDLSDMIGRYKQVDQNKPLRFTIVRGRNRSSGIFRP